MYCDCAVFVLSNSPRRPSHRHARGKTLFAAMLAKRGPSSHPGDGAFLYWTRRLHDFHSGFSYFHSPSGDGIFPRGTRGDPAMAIPAWHIARINRRIRGDLVSGEHGLTRSTHRVARIIHRLHGHILLGALRGSD